MDLQFADEAKEHNDLKHCLIDLKENKDKSDLKIAKLCQKISERDLKLKECEKQIPVSYTHLTLPTILLVQISVVAVSLKKKKRQIIKKREKIKQKNSTRQIRLM
eukprot:TRINITY_DN50341_c0_g1_i1.p3 TRINITY_DN50341_c0_g1~~TRINITY_DN50341_c0_g1_i1.p3  ORF type:complete len:105 (-),score=34.46 TRINITY_DN50341_c0_g1_i1:31-345(-)